MASSYTNLDGTTPDKSLGDLLRWQILDRLSGRRRADREPFSMPRVAPDGRVFASREARLGWIGHATFVMRLGGRLIATDPVWSQAIHTVSRQAPPGIELAELPPIDVVTVSHSHYDHMDLPTLRRIGPEALYVVPKEAGRAFELLGARRFVAMHWGTFRLTDEPLAEPPTRLEAWWAERRLPRDRLWIPALGETGPLA